LRKSHKFAIGILRKSQIMLKRKIQKVVREYLTSNSNKILVIDGARQIGKSYIIRYEGNSLFPNYIEINMVEDKKGDRVFENVRDVKDFYFKVSLVAGDRMRRKEDTLIFIDEIQVYPELLTLLKFLKDDDRYTYIVSGSQLGIALNETMSKPGGRIRKVRMYPMDFEEFLWANGVGEEAIDTMRGHFDAREPLDESSHNLIMDLFRKYLLVGGLPDAVNTFLSTRNLVEVRSVHEEIHALYQEDCSQYDKEHKLVIRRVYDLIPSNLENRKKRVQINDISGKKGKCTADYREEFEYVISSGIGLEVKAVSNPRFPMADSEKKNLLKLYLNDVGLLTNILFRYNAKAILDDMASINLGSVYENVVASELAAHGYSLCYYDNKKNGEVDFLIDNFDTLSTMPVEVKSGKDSDKHSSLDRFISIPDYHIQTALVLDNKREIRSDGKTTYIPVYYVMFLKPSTPLAVEI